MLSPMTTVFVLAVLWLIVVVPMILRRNDERRRERSVDGFGRAMRALGRRAEHEDADVFVPQRHRAERDEREQREQRMQEQRMREQRRRQAAVTPARPTVPSAQEALMFPVDRSQMSAARRQMMSRRRRSLATLVGGTLLFSALAFVAGGPVWYAAFAFGVGLFGYLYFLRSQAVRDRSRRQNRLRHAVERRSGGFDATEELARFEEAPTTVVRIDDDDIELQNMDTIDLTGIYEEELAAPAAQRRAS